jgi:hypothetical protein
MKPLRKLRSRPQISEVSYLVSIDLRAERIDLGVRGAVLGPVIPNTSNPLTKPHRLHQQWLPEFVRHGPKTPKPQRIKEVFFNLFITLMRSEKRVNNQVQAGHHVLFSFLFRHGNPGVRFRAAGSCHHLRHMVRLHDRHGRIAVLPST